ncbi:MAG: hypothetical protein HOP11_08620 [Saprospiraceae bacterium]|nr:hypothetical protein [Saprospiraceae bacterium]
MFKHPGYLALIFVVLGAILYFTVDIVPSDISGKNEQIKETPKESVNNQDDIAKLSPEQKAELDKLNEEMKSADSKQTIELLKKISGFWYKNGNFIQAGNAASKVADQENSAESWGIAGTSFLAGLSTEALEPDKKFCRDEAIRCLDKAIQLDSINPQHQMNKALCFVKLPDENPMQGIMMLLDLNRKFPEYIPVQITLSQLAIQTGQWDKAYDRLVKILKSQPDQPEANCLMIEVIEQSNRSENTKPYERFCNK